MDQHCSIGFDLDGTLVGHWDRRDGMKVRLRPEAKKWIEAARRRSCRVVLWTFGNRAWYETVAKMFPILRTFDEVWTRDELPGHITRDPVRGPEPVKDVRRLDLDLLIDNEPAHMRWATRHGLSNRYCIVPTFGEG